jgi:succinyl-diaminopimelate desuccinylase
MKRIGTSVGLLAALAAVSLAGDLRQPAVIEPALPVVETMPPLPEVSRPQGQREADGQRAFRAYVEASPTLMPSGTQPSGQGSKLQEFMNAPGTFELGDDASTEAFLGLAEAFARRRLFEPTLAMAAALVRFPTFRTESESDDAAFTRGMDGVAEFLRDSVAAMNKAQPDAEPLRFLEWRGPMKEGRRARILGATLGRGARHIAILTHLDTVAPIRDDWKPFEPRLEMMEFRGGKQLFLCGRGAIDDKGPTAAALQALDVLRSIYSGTPLFERCTFELIADTAEETHRWIPDYFDAVGVPETGDVLDAAWSLYAEKGSERPVFRVPAGNGTRGAKLRLVSLTTPPGPRNQIPDRATALFEPGAGGLQAGETALAKAVAAYLKTDNRRARLEVHVEGDQLAVVGIGSGAAHGSAPEVNLAHGHNPLACLAVFTAFLWHRGELEAGDPLGLPLFLAWAFGHEVHGEGHPDLLVAHDAIFTDGTTYALTRLTPIATGYAAEIDIRYALGHHGTAWDGKTFGTLPGDSRFQEIFTKLLSQFNATLPKGVSPVEFETKTGVGPDLKDRNSPRFRSLLDAYQAVVGRPSPVLAIGGGTDAKGYPNLYACGPNFSSEMTEVFSPPVKYHGVDEGAPVEDLTRSAEILVRWFAVTGFESR